LATNRLGPDGTRLVTVSSRDSDLVEVACGLFADVFPDDRRYLPYLRACTHGRHPSHPRTLDHVWLAQRGDEWVGVAIFSHILTRSFGHGAYVGIVPHAQGRGLGRWILSEMLNQLDEDARQFGLSGSIGYLGEVERPMDAQTEEERILSERRLQFHRQCGGVILPVPFIEPVMIESVDYLTPRELESESPRPMHLVFVPTEHGAQIPNLDLVNFIHGIYLDVYRLPAQHKYVRHSLSYLLETT
jgi:GNAT superfamily N-acetyltransferase